MATEVRDSAVVTSDSAAHEQTIQRYRDYVTTSFVAAIEPVAVGRAEGATVWDQDGTEYVDCFAGIETAMRLAKAYTGKHEFITLTHSFHGRSAGTLSITGNKARKTRGGPYLPGIAFAPAPYVYRNPFGTDDPEEVAARCAAMVEWAIDYQSSGDVAAFIAEPVMGEGGILVPPASYFRRGEGNPHPSG